MAFYDRSKKRGPTPKEQANWDRLAAIEVERKRKLREEQASGRRGADEAAKRRFMDQFRSP